MNAADILEQVSDQDRAWFSLHPDASAYIRPHIPGEFPGLPPLPADTSVCVTQVRPGFRIRRCVSSHPGTCGGETIAYDKASGQVVGLFGPEVSN